MFRHIVHFAIFFAPAYASDFNIVNLDNNTLPLLTGHHLPALVRFDRDYAYGDKADAYKKLAAMAVGAKVLIGTVGISTYGEKMNQDLAEKYGYKPAGKDLEYADMDKIFPKFRFFPANGGEEVDYSGDVTADAMMLFLKKEAKVYFGLLGTLFDFDKLASEFVKASDKDAVMSRAKSAAEAVAASDKEAASYYVKIMEKSKEKGDWFQKEYERLKQILSGGNVVAEKQDAMKVKMNRLSSFVSPHDDL